MAQNSIFNYKDVKNQPHRSAFDLSKRLLFTSKVGELLPVYCKPTMPGDKWHINLQSFTRTQTVQSSAFTRIKEYVDFFYIPYHLLWRNFQSSFTQIAQSSNFASSPIKDVPICDKLPYINQLQLFQYLYDKVDTVQSTDEVGASYYQQIFKLLAYLGYYDLTSYTRTTFKQNWSTIKSQMPNINVSLMPLLAYQKVYYDFYRNDRWEVNKPTAFNCDYMIDSTNYSDFVSNAGDVLSSGILNLHYANYAKDLFLGLLPSAQYGDTSVVASSVTGKAYAPSSVTLRGVLKDSQGNNVSSISVTDGNKISSTTGDKYFPVGTSQVGQLQTTAEVPYGTYFNISDASAQLDVLKLRQATALQKWKEITQCGDFNYRSQIEKHFGVKLPELMSHRCTYLGGTQGVIIINEVVNQNLIDNNEASIKGKGVGGINDGNISFDCKDHGLIMGIYYAIPYVDYTITGTRRDLSTVNIADLPIPEFDRLGFEPFSINEMFKDGVNQPVQSFVGYAPRYYNYKTDVDEVKGAFITSLPNWVAQYDSSYISKVLQTKNLNSAIKVNASILDDIFAVNAWSPDDATLQIDNDQLLNCINFEVHAVRNLDYSGVPY